MWLNIFNKHGNKSTLKHRRELTPNIKFQADRIFVRNDLFEPVIKSCKATNTEFLMFKEKLGAFLYEENYYEEEIIQIQDDIEETDKEPIKVIDRVSNHESNKELAKKISEVLNKYLDDSDEIDEMFKELTKSNKESNKESNKRSNKE